jgi:serine/threonine protein kinase
MKGGELFAKISEGAYSLTEKKCCGFVKQIVKGLNYIHERGIVHLDIKPQAGSAP